MSLKPGENYRSLKPLYIIFLCDFDPFGSQLYRYTFETICLETGESLDDGVKKVFLNCRGNCPANVSRTLIQFLKYVVKSDCETAVDAQDPFVSQVHTRLEQLKQDRQVEETYMLFEEMMAKERQEATARILELTVRMLKDGRENEIPRLKEDSAFLTDMLRKYGLEQSE